MIALSRNKLLMGAGLLFWAAVECCINEVLSTDAGTGGTHGSSGTDSNSSGDAWSDPSYSVFLFLGDLLLLLWMWGVSVHVWGGCGIPWAALLGLQSSPLAQLDAPEQAVYESAADLSIVYLSAFVLFNWANRGSNSISIRPGPALYGEDGEGTGLVLEHRSSSAASMAAVGELGLRHAICPALLAFFAYRAATPWVAKKQWWLYLYKVAAAPLFAVSFRCGYIGDILTSLVRVLSKALYSLLFVVQLPSALVTVDGYRSLQQEGLWRSELVQGGILPWLTLFPLWLRLMQCVRRSVESGQRWPHIANALKYTSAIMVVGIGALAPNIRAEYSVRAYVWVGGFMCATLYQFCWDITMDWGLLVPGSSRLADKSLSVAAALAVMLGVGSASDEYGSVGAVAVAADGDEDDGLRRRPRGGMSRALHWAVGSSALRKRRLLGPLWIYLAVMLANFLLRFAWTLTLLPPNSGSDGYFYSVLMTYLTPVIAAAEVLRRMVWGFLRLEWEHIEQQEKAALDQDQEEQDCVEGSSKDIPSLEAIIASTPASATASASASDALTEEEEEGGEEGEAAANAAQREFLREPLGRMSTSGAGADSGGGPSWVSWLYMSESDLAASGSTTLYGAADPDGRFHVLGPLLSALRTSLRLLLDGISCVAQRAHVVVAYAFGDEANKDNTDGPSSGRDGWFKKAFNGAKWIIAPLPRSWMRLIAKCVDLCMRDKLIPVLSSAARYGELNASVLLTRRYSAGAGSAAAGEGDNQSESWKISADSVDSDLQVQLIAEGVLFSLLLLLFLFCIAFV